MPTLVLAFELLVRVRLLQCFATLGKGKALFLGMIGNLFFYILFFSFFFFSFKDILFLEKKAIAFFRLGLNSRHNRTKVIVNVNTNISSLFFFLVWNVLQ